MGTVFGQLLFGWLADVFGRKRMCMHYLNHDFSMNSSDSYNGPQTALR